MIDVDRLRKDLINNYGALMMHYPAASIELSKVEKLSDNDLILFAEHIGVNLYNYLINFNDLNDEDIRRRSR